MHIQNHLNNIVFSIERNIRGIIVLYNIDYMYIRPQYLHSSVRTAMTQFMENLNKQFMFSSPLNMFSGQASWHVGLHQSEPGSTLFDSNATQVPLSSCDQNTLAIFPQGNLSISCCISVINLILEQRTCDVSLDMRFQTTDSLLNWIQKWKVAWQNLNLGTFPRRSSSTMGRRTVENKIVLFHAHPNARLCSPESR